VEGKEGRDDSERKKRTHPIFAPHFRSLSVIKDILIYAVLFRYSIYVIRDMTSFI